MMTMAAITPADRAPDGASVVVVVVVVVGVEGMGVVVGVVVSVVVVSYGQVSVIKKQLLV